MSILDSLPGCRRNRTVNIADDFSADIAGDIRHRLVSDAATRRAGTR